MLCRNPRCQNQSPQQYQLEVKESTFGDWQKLRLQENSSQVPPGSMPRSCDLILRNSMVERCKAGDVQHFVGMLAVLPNASALARAGDAPIQLPRQSSDAAAAGGGVRGLNGVKELTYRTCFLATSVLGSNNHHQNANSQQLTELVARPKTVEQEEFQSTEQVAMELTPAQRQEIRDMKSTPHLYSKMVQSICPDTFGHMEVKRGILLMILGGVHKTTSVGMKLRGDVNVCIVGDPSTAKSKFLKWVHAVTASR